MPALAIFGQVSLFLYFLYWKMICPEAFLTFSGMSINNFILAIILKNYYAKHN